MPRVNLHCHNAFSSDAAGTVEELARAARERGVEVLCLTNHVERLVEDGVTWVFDADEAAARLTACREEIERCRATVPGVEVLFGAELEYRPEWREGLERLGVALPFDFLLGSVHVVDGLQISGGPEVERAFTGRAEQLIYRAYFERVLEMVRWGSFDVVAHLDIVKRFGAAYYGPLEPSLYAEPLGEIFRECARRGIGVEVNASGLVAPCAETMPGRELLARAREAGVPFVTLGTDGHAPHQVDRGLEEAERTARRAGYREVAIFRGRTRGMVPLARSGDPDADLALTVDVHGADEAERGWGVTPGGAAGPGRPDPRGTAGSPAAGTGSPPARTGRCRRATAETSVSVAVVLDGASRSRIATGLGFFDHMLESLARHAMLDLDVEARGDLAVDEHHLVEDVGLALGAALAEALGERRGIRRFGSVAPMDESLAEAVIDLSGRPYLVFRGRFRRERIGDLPTELVPEFFRALSDTLRATLHLHVRYGRNDHHKIEALFKAFALALRSACEADPRRRDEVPSSKGTLTW